MKAFLIDASNSGWIAAIGLMGGMAWRSFSVGRRVGELETKIDIMLNEQKYLRERFDKHLDKQEGPGK